MISLSYSSDLSSLTVNMNLIGVNFRIGIASNKVIFSHIYTGFLSTTDYSVSSKSNTEISEYTSTIYPSQLTQQNVLDNFLTTGSGLRNQLSDWTISISKVSDYDGTVKITAS